jgi:hypothetical protein
MRSVQPTTYSRIALLLAVALATAVSCVSTAPALAGDSLQVAIGSASPEQGIPFSIGFSGASEAVDTEGDGPRLAAVVRPAGGIGCQSDYSNDHSAAGGVTTAIYSGEDFDSPREGPGQYNQVATYDPPEIGTYLVCAWLENQSEDGETTVLAGPVKATFSTRGPQVYQLTVALSHPALPGIAFQIEYTTHTDQQLALYSTIRPAGGLPCAVNHTLDGQQNQSETDLFGDSFLLGGEKVFGGPATIAATTTQAAGPYLICTWIEGPSENEVDATAATDIDVGTPAPPAPPPQKARSRSPALQGPLAIVEFQKFKVRPRLISQGASHELFDLRWSRWGGRVARARGRGDEGAGAANEHVFRLTLLEASDIGSCRGHRVYTHLRLHTKDPSRVYSESLNCQVGQYF